MRSQFLGILLVRNETLVQSAWRGGRLDHTQGSDLTAVHRFGTAGMIVHRRNHSQQGGLAVTQTKTSCVSGWIHHIQNSSTSQHGSSARKSFAPTVSCFPEI